MRKGMRAVTITTKYDIGQDLYAIRYDVKFKTCECCGNKKTIEPVKFKISKYQITEISRISFTFSDYEDINFDYKNPITEYMIGSDGSAVSCYESDIISMDLCDYMESQFYLSDKKFLNIYFISKYTAQTECDRLNAELGGDSGE